MDVRLRCPQHGDDRGQYVAGPYVTGLSVDPARPMRWVATTVRYDLETGRKEWVAREPLGVDAKVVGIVGASGINGTSQGSVIVVAMSAGPALITVAYDPSTGRRVWRRTYVGPRGRSAEVSDIVNASGAEQRTDVVVTGTSDGDYATVAYEGATGKELWVAREGGGAAYALDTTGEADVVTVTGVRDDPTKPSTFDYLIANGQGGPLSTIPSWDVSVREDVAGRIALSGTDTAGPAMIVNGSLAWQKQSPESFSTVQFSGDGRRVYLGERPNTDPAADQVEVLKSASGQIRSRTVLPENLDLVDFAVSPFSDAHLYVLGAVDGSSGQGDKDFLTMSIRPNSGVISWRARFGRYGRNDLPASISMTFTNSASVKSIIVTGASHTEAGHGLDYATVSYAA
ncbi:MAG: PQQ-binding-like beta-propeller repeat protein [Actinomycetota bacterium]|nr:PQQ-binding-like beta-propeller repeat protein [Actinomycetota bacterium]